MLDSTTIKLFANCMDWAKHRRRKAAAKLHLRLNLVGFLPAFEVVDSAKGHDLTKAHELCAGLKADEIAVFDLAYIACEAIEWQVWTALLMYALLRFLHTCSDWGHSFTRL